MGGGWRTCRRGTLTSTSENVITLQSMNAGNAQARTLRNLQVYPVTSFRSFEEVIRRLIWKLVLLSPVTDGFEVSASMYGVEVYERLDGGVGWLVPYLA